VFLSGDEEAIPKSLLQHIKIHRYLPTTVVLVISKTVDLPTIRPDTQLSCRALAPGLIKMTLR
jgi:K+ transporter